MLLENAYKDRIDEIVADNFVTDLRLAHSMSNLKNKILFDVQGWIRKSMQTLQNQYRNLCYVLHTGVVHADTPVQCAIADFICVRFLCWF